MLSTYCSFFIVIGNLFCLFLFLDDLFRFLGVLTRLLGVLFVGLWRLGLADLSLLALFGILV